MTLAIILALLAAAVPPLLVWMAKGQIFPFRRETRPAERIRAVDVEAFRNLTDPLEEEYLRTNLPPADFRRIQRERLRAAMEYISCAKRNAAILAQAAQAARRSPDSATAQAASKVVDDAIRLRLYAFLILPRLYVGMILPGRRVMPARVVENYEHLTRQVVRLGLQFPASGISASL